MHHGLRIFPLAKAGNIRVLDQLPWRPGAIMLLCPGLMTCKEIRCKPLAGGLDGLGAWLVRLRRTSKMDILRPLRVRYVLRVEKSKDEERLEAR